MVGQTQAHTFVYAGSFFGPSGEGIRLYRWDDVTGALDLVSTTKDGVENPLYLEPSPDGRTLYVADCLSDWEQGGAVSAHAIDPATGEVTFLNRQPSGGTIPVHVSVSSSGNAVLVANCGPWTPAKSSDRTVAVLDAQPDGRLGETVSLCAHTGSSIDPLKQTAPHPHALVLDPAERYAFAPDLGTDRIAVYDFDRATGRLEPDASRSIQTTAGCGPRHLRFHPNGRFAYLTTEIAGTIIGYAYDSVTGRLTHQQTVSMLPQGYEGERNAADLRIHPSGRFLYASNRGHHSIALFAIDIGTGTLTPHGHTLTLGKSPRAFAIDPTGDFLLVANEYSDSLVSFHIDRRTGDLTPTGNVTAMPRPACLAFAQTPARRAVGWTSRRTTSGAT
jgi:6-phosphogluconolactonase